MLSTVFESVQKRASLIQKGSSVVMTEIDCLDPDPQLNTRSPMSFPGTVVKNEPSRRPPLAPKSNHANTPGGSSYVGPRASVGDPQCDEEWSDGLSFIAIR